MPADRAQEQTNLEYIYTMSQNFPTYDVVFNRAKEQTNLQYSLDI